MAILKFILFVVLFYYLAKSLVRLLFPFLLKNLNDKMNSSNNTDKKEGDVSIKFTKKDKKIDKDIGEYTDYEELDNK